MATGSCHPSGEPGRGLSRGCRGWTRGCHLCYSNGLMSGILGAAAYVPRYRLPREVIAREVGGVPGRGERAVANHDEDSLTMAVNAALGLAAEAGRPEAVVFATTSPPYAEKQGAATIAAVLDLPPTTRTLDVGTTLRAGTSAVLAAPRPGAAGAAARGVGAARRFRPR